MMKILLLSVLFFSASDYTFAAAKLANGSACDGGAGLHGPTGCNNCANCVSYNTNGSGHCSACGGLAVHPVGGPSSGPTRVDASKDLKLANPVDVKQVSATKNKAN